LNAIRGPGENGRVSKELRFHQFREFSLMIDLADHLR
jgi:hypothetical protein